MSERLEQNAPEDDSPPVDQGTPPVDEPEEQPTDTAAAPDAPHAEPEAVVELAREMGWSPKAEWRGDPNAWRPAKDFIKRGPEIQRELRQQRDRERTDFEQRIARIEGVTKHALTQQLEDRWGQIETRFEAAELNAVQSGDVQGYNNLQQQKRQARRDFDTWKAKQQEQHAAPQLDPAVVEFASRNEWYNRDPGMTGAAISHLDDVNARFPNLPLVSALTMVEAAIKRDFPHRFTGNRPQNGATPHAPPQVEGGGLRSIKTKAAKDWNSLPPEAKQAGARFVKDGLFKDNAAYAADYWAQE